LLDDEPAFELSFWCGTCPFLFKRLEGSNETLSLAALERHLAEGVDGVDEAVIDRFASLLPPGEYMPLLLRVRPRLVWPVAPGDYFSEEQVATWNVDGFWGLPEYPQTPYYRTFETPVDSDAHFYEFIVPMVPPSWNDRDRVEEHRKRLVAGDRSTAVAVSLLDVCEPAVETGARDPYAHWCLTHFLLDGHHKTEAAASSGEALQLLSLLAVEESLAAPEEITKIAQLRARPEKTRPV
jgi:hypothetical protein